MSFVLTPVPFGCVRRASISKLTIFHIRYSILSTTVMYINLKFSLCIDISVCMLCLLRDEQDTAKLTVQQGTIPVRVEAAPSERSDL
jgi:hypothetical protein